MFLEQKQEKKSIVEWKEDDLENNSQKGHELLCM